MRLTQPFLKYLPLMLLPLIFGITTQSNAQTLAFPGAQGFGRFAPGARGAATQEVYIVTNLNDSGAGSFRDAVSKQGRIVTFAVGGIINLLTNVVVSPNVTIAGQTAPGSGIVLFNKPVSFSGSNNTIARYFRIRLGATNNSGKDASGLSNGANVIFDHMTFTWGMDEVFSINWDSKGNAPDNITLQHCIIGQGLHRENHSAGGLMQPSGGKISLYGNLYTSNKTRNNKIKGINEFVNNVVYNWGNANRLGDIMNYGWSGEAYIMGGDSNGESFANIINNYFIGGPSTNPSTTTPFNRGNANFNLYGTGNYMDNNQDGALNGDVVPYDLSGYPTDDLTALKSVPYDYPLKNTPYSALDAYQKVVDSVGASYPRRDQVDSLMIADLKSKGTSGYYVYRETNLPFSNGGLGNVFNAPAPLDSDADGMPDAWEDSHGLNKNNNADATLYSNVFTQYLNIEVYINSLVYTPAVEFVKTPTNIILTGVSTETPLSSTVTIKWTDNSNNEDHFVLERSADGINFTEISQPAANVNTYVDANLVPNTIYYYRIKSVSTTETSSYSTAVSITTPPIPTAPTKAVLVYPMNAYQFAEINSGNVTLKWTGNSNSSSYSIYLGTNSNNLTKIADVVYSASPSYVATGLTPGTNYFWRVDASNAKGAATGDLWSFRTMPNVATGMVGYWAFDETAAEGSLVQDSTAYANHGVLGLNQDNGSIRIAGKVRNGLDFATANPALYVVNIPNQDQLFLDKSSFSVSFWMKADISLLPTGTNSSYLLCKGSITKNLTTGATGKRFDIEFKSGQFRFAIDDDILKKELSIANGAQFFTGNWVHVVVMRDLSVNQLRVYLNGSSVGTLTGATMAGGIGEASAFVVGNIGELEFLANTNAPAPYKGQLDELKVFNYALSPSEITTLSVGGTLPVNLVNYTAIAENNRIHLKWKVSSEQNNDRFEMERSSDGINFEKLWSVKGRGNSSQPFVYESYDHSPLKGINYYRLMQYDFDGKALELGIKSVNFDLNKNDQILVYPIPVNKKINIKIPFYFDKDIQATVSNLNGLKIFSQQISSTDNGIFVINLPEKPQSGLYLLELTGRNLKFASKIMID
jgi:hypothetical protein